MMRPGCSRCCSPAAIGSVTRGGYAGGAVLRSGASPHERPGACPVGGPVKRIGDEHRRSFRPDRLMVPRVRSTALLLGAAQLQPLVLPQPSQTKQLPAGRIFVPQFMHSGASADVPMIDSTSSVELCAVGGASCAVSTTTSSCT